MGLVKSLTASERFILSEVDSVPDKVVSVDLLRRTGGRHLTRRGYQTVVNRLVDRSLLGRVDGDFGKVTLTFSGMRSLRAQVSA